jgi:hypothetical protein
VADFFKLVLDTLGPQSPTFSVAAGASVVASQTTAVNFGTSDSPTTGYQVKIWGDVDPTFNANIKATEGESSWITYSAEVAVKLSSGDGTKNLHAKIRDDVWNATAELSDSIVLDTTIPVVTITAGPTPTKISEVSGKDTAAFTFKADSAIVQWVVKVVPSSASAHTAGTTIGTSNGSENTEGGSLSAETAQEVKVKGGDFAAAAGADGEYTIKVFAKDAAGNWSA